MEHFSPVLVTSDRCVVPGADGSEFCVACARHQALELGQAGHHEEPIVADKPRHCDHCGMLLEVTMSPAGIAYIESALQTVIDAQDFDPAIADGDVLAGWRTQYSGLLDEEIKAGFESMWGGKAELKTRLDDDTVAEHTPEPWNEDPEGEEFVTIEGADGSEVCDVRGASNDPLGDANARRIVAAVNACAGIHTDELERCRKLIFYPNTDSHRGTE